VRSSTRSVDDHERHRLSDSGLNRRAQGDDVSPASSALFLACALPGPPRPAAPLHGRIDGAFRSWGSRGGTGAISNAIADAARELGAEIRTEAPIAKIIVKSNRAQGVVLQNGDEIYGDVISSSVDPRLTFIKFIEENQLPGEFLEDVRRYKFRGSSGKVNIALDALPDFKCLPGPGAHLRGAISISPSVEYMERAYDDAKYGNFSRRPYIDMVIPSLTDPSVAPPGKHVMSCLCSTRRTSCVRIELGRPA
jgi:phytoene dehydrogenase-like protein